jgi:hypothetical protein
MTATQPPKRVRARHLAWVNARLSERDWKILEAVNHLHLLTGWQLDGLFFAHLTNRSRIVTRSRSLSRLVAWRVLVRLPRRIGGARRGSSVAVYALGSAGQRLLALRANGEQHPPAIRKVGMPSDRFVAHIVAVSELYVCLAEANRIGSLLLRQFTTEPVAWWPNGRGGWLKPDAFFVVSNGQVDHLWWAEVDRATESAATIHRKLRTYLEFVNRGGLGPREAIPRVLLTVPDEGRQQVIRRQVARLPLPAPELFHVLLHDEAAPWVTEALER